MAPTEEQDAYMVEVFNAPAHVFQRAPDAASAPIADDDTSTTPDTPQPAGAVAPSGDPAAAQNLAGDPGPPSPASQGDSVASGTDEAKRVNVTIVTKYGQSVRYWVKDCAEGAGNAVLIDGEEHGPDESIQINATYTINGASLCYQRESYANPPGGGLTDWSFVEITDGDTFTIPETPQVLGAPAPSGDATTEQPPAGDDSADQPQVGGTPAIQAQADAAPANVSSSPAVPAEQLTGGSREALVTRADAEAALTTYLARALSDQGSQTVRITAAVRAAVVKIGAADAALAGRLDAYLNGKLLPGSPRELAAAIGKLLPDALPAAAIAHLPQAATTDAKDKHPKSVADAVGKSVADQITPTVRNLPLERPTQDKLLDIARSGSPDAIIAGMNKILDLLPIDDKLRASVEAILEAAVKQGAAPMDRQQDGAGSPYAHTPPPSAAPGAPKAPNETIITTPSVPWEFPGVRPPPKADPPRQPEAADGADIAAVIGGIDDACLIPKSVRGTPAAGDYASARQVARDLANRMDEGRRGKKHSIDFLLGTQYPSSDETLDAFDQLKAIVEKIGAALPNGGAPLGRVLLQIAPPQDHAGAAMQQQVLLRNGS